MSIKTSLSEKRVKLGGGIKNRIFVGFILSLPIITTVWFFKFLIDLVSDYLPTRITIPYFGTLENPFAVKTVVLLLIVLFFFLLGAAVQNFLGKQLYALLDAVFGRIPFVKSIYSFVRQICEWVARSRSQVFQKVVLIEYPRKGSYAVAFQTSESQEVLNAAVKDENGNPTVCVNLFLPTTPNPTSGFFLVVPKKDIIETELDVSAGINLIISAGAILPTAGKAKEGSVLDMIDGLVEGRGGDGEKA